MIALLPPLTVADLGAGEGTLSQLLAKNARKVIAVDNAPKMVEFGSQLAKKHGFKNLEYRLGDIEDPPIDEELGRSRDFSVRRCITRSIPSARSPPPIAF